MSRVPSLTFGGCRPPSSSSSSSPAFLFASWLGARLLLWKRGTGYTLRGRRSRGKPGNPAARPGAPRPPLTHHRLTRNGEGVSGNVPRADRFARAGREAGNAPPRLYHQGNRRGQASAEPRIDALGAPLRDGGEGARPTERGADRQTGGGVGKDGKSAGANPPTPSCGKLPFWLLEFPPPRLLEPPPSRQAAGRGRSAAPPFPGTSGPAHPPWGS